MTMTTTMMATSTAADRSFRRAAAAAGNTLSTPIRLPSRASSGRLLWGGRRRAAASAVVTASNDLKDTLETLMTGTDLSAEQTQEAVSRILNGAPEVQTAAFLALLRAKGETADEIAGMAQAMINNCVRVDIPDLKLLDIVGTGGDGAGTVNISTGACVIAAAAGAKVAKHGNRSVSSQCGSADVLEALGVSVELGPEEVSECVRDVGVAFMFAPRYHPAMRTVVPVRKALRVRTAFNILGPLLNPAQAKYSLVGVYSPSLVPLMAETLLKLGTEKSLVVHQCGLDELAPIGEADIVEVTQKGIKKYKVDPKDMGIPRCTLDDLKGGNKNVNAQMLMDAFGGEDSHVANALNLNAGVALAACGVTDTVEEGILLAMETQRSGKAADVMTAWREKSQALSNKS